MDVEVNKGGSGRKKLKFLALAVFVIVVLVVAVVLAVTLTKRDSDDTTDKDKDVDPKKDPFLAEEYTKAAVAADDKTCSTIGNDMLNKGEMIMIYIF